MVWFIISTLIRKLGRLHLGFNSSCNHCHINQIVTVHRDPNSHGNAAEPQGPRSHLQGLTFTWRTERKHIYNDDPCWFIHHPPLISKHQAQALSDSESSQDLGKGVFSLKEWSGIGMSCPGRQWGHSLWKNSRGFWLWCLGLRLRGDCGWGRLMIGLDLEGLFQPWGFCDEGVSSITNVWMPVLRYLKCACSCVVYEDPCWRKGRDLRTAPPEYWHWVCCPTNIKPAHLQVLIMSFHISKESISWVDCHEGKKWKKYIFLILFQNPTKLQI